jgi:hypothetical protein
MPLDQHGRVIGIEGACIADDRDLAFFVAVWRDDASPELRRQTVLVVDSIRQSRSQEIGDFLRGLASPVRVPERDHVVDRPGIVGGDIGEHEARNAFGVVNSHDQGNTATRIVSHKMRALDSEMIH